MQKIFPDHLKMKPVDSKNVFFFSVIYILGLLGLLILVFNNLSPISVSNRYWQTQISIQNYLLVASSCNPWHHVQEVFRGKSNNECRIAKRGEIWRLCRRTNSGAGVADQHLDNSTQNQ
jgi:hypothetical protein